MLQREKDRIIRSDGIWNGIHAGSLGTDGSDLNRDIKGRDAFSDMSL